VPGQLKIVSISAKGNPIDYLSRKGSQHIKKIPILPQVTLRSTRNQLVKDYLFCSGLSQIRDLYPDIVVRESMKGRRDVGVHEQTAAE
jgi:hypothetical protein